MNFYFILALVFIKKEKVTKVLVERLVRRWVEGDDFEVVTNANQIILKNLTLKEVIEEDCKK